jgi:hypothetical protein
MIIHVCGELTIVRLADATGERENDSLIETPDRGQSGTRGKHSEGCVCVPQEQAGHAAEMLVLSGQVPGNHCGFAKGRGLTGLSCDYSLRSLT